MQGVEVKEEFQDELMQNCKCCGQARIVAYWDYELESYICLSESDLCLKCETTVLEKDFA